MRNGPGSFDFRLRISECGLEYEMNVYNFGMRISDCGAKEINPKSAFRNPKFNGKEVNKSIFIFFTILI